MKKVLLLVGVLVLVRPSLTLAQNSQDNPYGLFNEARLQYEVLQILDQNIEIPANHIPLPEEKLIDWKFWTIGAALNGVMIVDLKSTYDSKERCPTCVETNPYAAPFVERGPFCAYIAATAFEIGVMYLAYRMRGSKDPFWRKKWMIPPLVITGLHIYATDGNYRLRN